MNVTIATVAATVDLSTSQAAKAVQNLSAKSATYTRDYPQPRRTLRMYTVIATIGLEKVERSLRLPISIRSPRSQQNDRENLEQKYGNNRHKGVYNLWRVVSIWSVSNDRYLSLLSNWLLSQLLLSQRSMKSCLHMIAASAELLFLSDRSRIRKDRSDHMETRLTRTSNSSSTARFPNHFPAPG